MHKERDPRVVAVAEKLAMAQPYGFEYVKSGPSAADYHAALIAVQTLDEVTKKSTPVYTVAVGSEVRTRSGTYPSVPYVKQMDGSWKPKYEYNHKAGGIEDV